jgi:serine/threonine protein kinase/TPR repeat protein
MSPEFHQRVRDLFDEALEKPEAERRGFVAGVCRSDTKLLLAVIALLDAHGEADAFLEEPAAPRAQRIGRYQLVRELGRGGMGVVYEALDPLIARNLAVKLIPLKSLSSALDPEQTWKQLLTEAQSAGLLSHPNIVVVFDVGQEDEIAFIAMERVEGPSLQQVLDSNKKVPGQVGLDLLRQTAAALDYAHESGVLHRDIKPANVMIHRGTTVKITDFGLAKITSNPKQTRSMVMGTPAYMSPERIAMQPLDGRCDQFSLAVIAFQMLTGAKPFDGASVPEVLFRITSRERPSVREFDPGLPEAVDAVLHRALAMRAEDRYATCSAFVAALQESLRKRTEPAPSKPPLVATQRAAVPSRPPVPLTPPPPSTPPLAPTLAATRVATVAPVAPVPPVAPPRKKSRWPIVALAAAGTVVAAGLGVLAVRKFAPPPAEVVPVNPVLPPVGQRPAQPPPSIVRFAAEPDTIEPGATAKVSWDVAGASEVEIQPSIGVVAPTGAFPVSPSSPTNYQLTATGPGGQRVKVSVLVDVRAKSSVAVIKAPPATKPPGKALTIPQSPPATPAEIPPPPQIQTQTQVQPQTQTHTQIQPPPVDSSTRARNLYQQAWEARRKGQSTKAVELFRAAAELGDLRSMVEAGKMYRAGEGVASDIHESARWFHKAADGGYAPAMVLVGSLYFEGKAYPRDQAEAVRWFRKAADANDALGMDELGLMYANGFGVGKDEHQAFLWFEKAAKAGNHFGLFHLGRCFERGIGVAKDMTQAAHYYEKAAAAGNADAKARLSAAPGGITVAGNRQWSDTAIALKAGDTVVITASGSMAITAAQRVPPMTPSGSSANCAAAAQLYGSSPGSPAPTLPCWSLIGRVGPSGPIFAVGAGKSFRAATPGQLYLGINHENVGQNAGNWRAVIKVQQ